MTTPIKNPIIPKLVIVQSLLVAQKSEYNSYGKYPYRTSESILSALKPLLSDQGLFISISDQIELIGDRYYNKSTVSVKDDEGNVECSSAFAREPISFKGMSEGQLSGSTSSYARKYALCGMFGIDDSKEDLDNKDNSKQSDHVNKVKELQDQITSMEKSRISNLSELINSCSTLDDLITLKKLNKDLISSSENVKSLFLCKYNSFNSKQTKDDK